MILEIVQYGNPVLRQRCEPVREVTEEHRQLAVDMLETMVDAQGVGLAAPQIGRAIRMAVIDVSHDPESVDLFRVAGNDARLEDYMPLVFINPELDLDGPKVADVEGCLSIEDIRGTVSRPEIVRARLPQLDGSVLEIETDGLLARALQHEVDHLNGVLFVDRLSAAAKTGIRRKLKRLGARC